MDRDPFQKYLKESEPDKLTRGYAWSTAIGLQAVDGLRPSEYLINTAVQNIEGEITLQEAKYLIDNYYQNRPSRSDEERTEEADKVSARIAEILSETAFSFTPNEYMAIHRRLFQGIYSHAGKIRDYNITKKEWVLDGATVLYGSASELKATLEYDFAQERNFSYRGLSMDEIIHHLAVFISRLWQIHIFGEGNTRTTAVFFIKYLKTLGFSATNDIFAQNAWYFRNALVRANYTDLKKGVYETTEYLEIFLRNLLLNEKNELHNRYLHISGLLTSEKVDIEGKKVDVVREKVDIEGRKADIDEEKVDIESIYTERMRRDIESIYTERMRSFSEKTIAHVRKMYDEFGCDMIFGRSAVVKLLGLQNSSVSKLLSKLLKADIIEPIPGCGKGKYRFSAPVLRFQPVRSLFHVV